jgi:hypothetical protein
VPVYDDRTRKSQYSRVFLVENHGIRGLSGSPVFVRQTRSLTYPTPRGQETVLVPSNNVDLLGVFVGAWFLPPSHPMREALHLKTIDTVPIGLGMVVPAQRLLELLEMPELREARLARQKALGNDQTNLRGRIRPKKTVKRR